MQTVRGLEISQKVLLGEEAFIKYKRENRKWYAILCMALVSIFIMVAFAIINKELELGIYIGALLFVYCIPLGVLASKIKVALPYGFYLLYFLHQFWVSFFSRFNDKKRFQAWVALSSDEYKDTQRFIVQLLTSDYAWVKH